ncbi:type VI secretion system membrane subunit TssM [Tropicimonas sp. S265A]|uniref:type VI secretion system membrane subunit TssM n=1 Tax=Tropicimonas sp. S265A TaxID=3415134 RepID=UPI003C799519
MRKVLGVLLSTAFQTCFFTAIISLFLWFLGPLLAVGAARPLDSLIERGLVIGLLWLLVIVFLTIRYLRIRRRDKDLTEEIAAVDPRDEALADELKELSVKLKAALATLRSSKSGRRQLYELPWYVIIGPPGAGKTTAIVNSGLNFPIDGPKDSNAIGGVGGTRNCDWWFTEDAILIDTAGRYTTQDSDTEADNAAWLGFLNILKKYRKRQPINGALVAISLSDLSMQDHETQMSHARAVRRRILELREQLGIRFPVYVLFTKSDLIAGFAEYFEPLGKEDREQVWGFTFDADQAKAREPALARFDDEFGLLLSQINGHMLERLTSELDPDRRGQIAAFPSQLASIRQVAKDFLNETFQETKYEDRILLRGVYFTSGTQEGTPIDRLMTGMARVFGVGRAALGTGRGTGKSFFITRLFRDVVFPEAGLVSVDDSVERSYRWITRGAIAAAVLTAIGVSGLWLRSYLGNQALIAEASETVSAYRTAERAIPKSPIGDTDLPSVVPAMNLLRDLPDNPLDQTPEDIDLALQFGLYQGDVIGTKAAQSYRSALNQHFLPRLLLRLEEQLQGNMNNSDFLYEGLKVYLMLGLDAPATDPELVSDWMEADWALSYPGESRATFRADLSSHLHALLSGPMQKVDLNGPLIDQIRVLLAEMSLSERIYNGIISSAVAKELPEWRVVDIAGPAAGRVMTRSSGAPLSAGVPGIFTYRGFNEVFLEEALDVASRFQNERWVLGEGGGAAQSDLALAQMSRDVLGLYYTDYVEHYDRLLGDLDIVPLNNLSHAVEVTNVLSGPTSPIVNILEAVAQETRLTEERSVVSPDTEQAVGDLAAQNALRSIRNRRLRDMLNVLARAEGNTSAPAVPGAYVEDRFAWLHTLVQAEEGTPSELDGIIAKFEEVYRELNRMSLNSAQATGSGATEQLMEAVTRLPGPLKRWASQVTSGSSGITAEGTRSQINARWQSEVAPFCAQALSGRYPLSAQATQEVTIQDFSRAFAPGGLIDKFFTDHLLQHVDTRARPWAWKTINQAELGISDAVLKQFQYASEIRDTFFAGGGAPSIPFELTPQALDPSAQSVTLDIDGQSVSYQHGDQISPAALKWPGQVGLGRISFFPPSNTIENELTRDGPWGWFRLLSSAEVRDTEASEKKRVIFKVGGLIAIYEMRMGSAFNPFTLDALSSFQCPDSL